jgi:lipopolysaccharide biosynthesis glycosyltransferase
MIPFVFIFDKNLIPYFIHTCKSIQRYLTCDYKFLIITDLSENIPEIETQLALITDTYHYVIKTPHESDKSFFSSIYYGEARSDIRSLNYIQIAVPEYFPEYDYLFFMEPDQVLRQDLVPLWQRFITDKIGIGIVPYGIGRTTAETLRKLYVHRRTTYLYNCGVMFYDCKFWKDNCCKEKCIQAILKQKELSGGYYNYYAEGAINVALQELITPIDPRLNICNLGWDSGIHKSQLESAIILHWNGERKPWKITGLYKEYYTIL